MRLTIPGTWNQPGAVQIASARVLRILAPRYCNGRVSGNYSNNRTKRVLAGCGCKAITETTVREDERP